jgi:hypothetical protein
LKAAGIQ